MTMENQDDLLEMWQQYSDPDFSILGRQLEDLEQIAGDTSARYGAGLPFDQGNIPFGSITPPYNADPPTVRDKLPKQQSFASAQPVRPTIDTRQPVYSANVLPLESSSAAVYDPRLFSLGYNGVPPTLNSLPPTPDTYRPDTEIIGLEPLSLDIDDTHKKGRSRGNSRGREKRVEQGFECDHPTCERKFNRACDARKHYGNVHLPKTRPCHICNSLFTYPKDVTRHLKQIHSFEDTSAASNDDEEENTSAPTSTERPSLHTQQPQTSSTSNGFGHMQETISPVTFDSYENIIVTPPQDQNAHFELGLGGLMPSNSCTTYATQQPVDEQDQSWAAALSSCNLGNLSSTLGPGPSTGVKRSSVDIDESELPDSRPKRVKSVKREKKPRRRFSSLKSVVSMLANLQIWSSKDPTELEEAEEYILVTRDRNDFRKVFLKGVQDSEELMSKIGSAFGVHLGHTDEALLRRCGSGGVLGKHIVSTQVMAAARKAVAAGKTLELLFTPTHEVKNAA